MQKHSILVLLVITVCLLGSSTVFAAPPADGPQYHTAQAGETLMSIARRYGVSLDALVAANGISNPNFIRQGQRLVIPDAGSVTSTSSAGNNPSGGSTAQTYTVRSGDTLASIATRYGTSIGAIARASGLANPNSLRIGQQLTIPGAGSAGQPATAQRSVPAQSSAPAPAAAPQGSFIYGIQAHMIGTNRAPVIRSVRELGFSWVKQQIEWKNEEPAKGQINWGAMDRIVNDMAANGITVLFSIVKAPRWARQHQTDFSVEGPPTNVQDYADFVSKVAARYCNRGVGAIEVWNEQNLHYEWGNETINAARYMKLLQAAYTAIKSACPQMLVVSGALTPTGAPAPWAQDDFAYLQEMYNNGLARYSDAIGAHPSGFNVPPTINHTQACNFIQKTKSSFTGPCDAPHHSWSFRSTLEGYRNIMVRNGDAGTKIWVTEFGWAAGGAFHPDYQYANDNSFEEQAAWTVEAYQFMRRSGWVGAAFLWNLNFRVVADGSEKAQWGIVTNNWSPLPAYAQLQRMPK